MVILKTLLSSFSSTSVSIPAIGGFKRPSTRNRMNAMMNAGIDVHA